MPSRPRPSRVAWSGSAALLAVLVLGLPESAPAALRADRIVVEKSARRLTLYRHGFPVRSYKVALGGEPVRPKRCEGDRRTPEGTYRIDSRNAASAYHRSLHVSYPNAADAAAALRLGCRPGGDIMIHGLRNGYGWLGARHTAFDWTLGCIAVTDREIEEIWDAVPNGTPVEIRP